ncbi:MAG: alanine--tRNA ligase, partial [Deltaproteobacteria bacterium]|nr:alanine--tRNA ligase [Deltaproteobacteria bacterium]
SRAEAFLTAVGVLPYNEGRGYVLRRLLRRALRFATLMGVHEPFLYRVTLKVAEVMGEAYPELCERAAFLSRVVREEEERFSLTLGKGLVMLEDELARLEAEDTRQVPGAVAFTLYDTYGFPLDIVNDVAQKRGFSVDEAGFAAHMREQKERSRAARKGSGFSGQDGEVLGSRFKALLDDGLRAEFVGYHALIHNSRITALLDGDASPVDSLKAGESGFVVTGQTPFYGASGGQVGDVGSLEAPAGKADVIDTLKPSPELAVHRITVREGLMLPDQEVAQRVAEGERLASARNHTGTHLLHAALRRVLGDHVKQAGSLVAPDRLRFDFSHIAALSREEVSAVENEVNRMILADYPVTDEELTRSEATSRGAVALFGEKYADVVRVVSVGQAASPESLELCGGTHLDRTGRIGLFTITAETGIAAGVRRIEAATGWNVLREISEQREVLHRLADRLKSRPGELADKVDALQKELKAARKDLERAATQATSGRGRDLMDGVEDCGGVKLLIARLDNTPIKALREIMDDVRSKLPTGIACLAAQEGEKINLILYVSKELHDRFTAPALIKDVAVPIGGSGGGRPDQAQAGGTNPAGFAEAMNVLRSKL